jgi:Tol biopolymer transport system component
LIRRPGARWLVVAIALSLALSVGPGGARDIPSPSELVAIDRDGRQTNLTRNPAWDLAPAVSRDGRIVFLSMRDGRSDLYVMDGDGSNIRRLTTSPFDDSEVVWSDVGMSQASWSRRGTTIAFDTQNATVPAGCFHDCIYWRLHVGDVAGGAPRRVTADGQAPAWSPDGRRLAYGSGYEPGDAATFRVTIARLDGSSSVDVQAPNPSPRSGPAWSPDSKQLAFQARARPAGPTWIYVVRADGRHKRRLAHGRNPTWSSDGRRLAFVDNYRLTTIGEDGKSKRRLSRSGELVTGAAWSPKVSRIAVVAVSSLGTLGGPPADLRVETVSADGKHLRVLAREPAGSRIWSGPVWTPDGKRILVAVG